MSMIKKMIAGKWWCGCLLLLLAASGCKKLVEAQPPANSIDGEGVFTNDLTATSIMTGLYAQMSEASMSSTGIFSAFMRVGAALGADELILHPVAYTTGDFLAYYRNRLTNTIGGPWSYIYRHIYTCNSVIEGVQTSTSLSPNVKQQLEGEARFLRAYEYFYLVNLYGDIPMPTTTDYKVNGRLTREPAANVYDLIIADLKQAQTLLSEGYLGLDLKTATEERVRPNKYAATALLARVYLYRGVYDQAEMQATKVIDKKEQYDTVTLGDIFLKNGKETLWELQPVTTAFNTEDARFFIIPATGPDPDHCTYLSARLLDSFEIGDRRRTAWIGKYTDITVTPQRDYYYPYKYKSATLGASITEYHVELRLAEQYLIRAEARARQGKTADAAADLNVIRHRAGLPNTIATSEETLVNAVLHERQIELFTEGHRWLDIKRSGMVDAVMTAASADKGTEWDTRMQWYPVPRSDLQRVTGMTQNAGY